MNNSRITIPIKLLLLFILTLGCVEDPLEEKQIALQSQPNSFFGPDVKVNESQLITVFIEWKPTTLDVVRNNIRSLYSNINGNLFLHSLEFCPVDSNVETWKVLQNNLPKDKTPDPLVILNDHEDEMQRPPGYVDICIN